MKNDLRGVPVTGGDTFALRRYETALEQFQTYAGDPIATIDEALQAAPAFIAGHMLKALALYTLTERKFVPMVTQALEAARQHAARANDRELGLISATELLVAGRWDSACRAIDRVLVDHPRDALALQVGHLMDFYRGDALNLRNRISRVLPHWDASVPGYSYVLGMHAFGLEEMGQYPEAEATALTRSMQPRDGWAVHAAVHVMEMQGRIDEGIAFLTSREADWAPDNAFAFHNFWHLALFHMDGAHYDRALDLFDRHVHPQPAAYLLSLVDATALLWRLRLEGVDIADRFDRVADDWRRDLTAKRALRFNDAHAAMALASTGCETAHRVWFYGCVKPPRTGARVTMTREVGLPLVEGVAAFALAVSADSIAAIEPMRDQAHRFGGSHAQRDVITLDAIEAALRNSDHTRARHYIAERLVHKLGSQWGQRLWSRATSAPHLARQRDL
jgi:tetratricopeptide (TPR) repeat protein